MIETLLTVVLNGEVEDVAGGVASIQQDVADLHVIDVGCCGHKVSVLGEIQNVREEERICGPQSQVLNCSSPDIKTT